MLLRPDLMVSAAHEVDPDMLSLQGIEGVLVDLDDTLLPSNSDRLAQPYRNWLDRLEANGIGVVILSNGERRRVTALSDALGVPALPLVGKPFRFAFRRGLQLLGTQPQATAMIGDQLFTDILGANLSGVHSILVSPLTPGKLPHTRVARHIERWVLRAQKQRPEGGARGRTFHR